ncbi:MAG: penicillin-binding protein activator [Burkholderiaceae bacterium]
MFARRRLLQGLLAGAAAGPALIRAQTPPASSGGSAAPRPSAAARQRLVFGNGPTRIALLIESSSDDYAAAAKSVIAGVKTAWTVDGADVTVEVLPLAEADPGLARTVQALQTRGFSMAIGPLTRDNVNAIVDLGVLPVPVLALNLPDVDRYVPRNVTFFSLAIEGEGRQVADQAHAEAAVRAGGRRPLQALLIGDSSSLARRGLAAFGQRWSELGGAIVDTVEIDAADAGDWRSVLASAQADAAFTVVSPDNLRMVRAALRTDIPLFGTSQLNAVQANIANRGPELDGIRFVDMPWQIDPTNTAVMAYPRERTLRHLDFQRLYALGIDAYRVARMLVRGETRFELDGVTGWLRVDLQNDLRIERQAVAAEFRSGQVVPLRMAAR